MEENVLENVEEKEEVVSEEKDYSIRHLEDILGIPSDSRLFNFGR